MTFLVSFGDGRSEQITADFMTCRDLHFSWATIRFWVKPFWWSRKRMVGVVAAKGVVSVANRAGDVELLQAMGVKVSP